MYYFIIAVSLKSLDLSNFVTPNLLSMASQSSSKSQIPTILFYNNKTYFYIVELYKY